MLIYFCLDFLFCIYFDIKVIFLNLCNLILLLKRVIVWVKWDMFCFVLGLIILFLLIWKVRVSFVDFFGFCYGRI